MNESEAKMRKKNKEFNYDIRIPNTAKVKHYRTGINPEDSTKSKGY